MFLNIRIWTVPSTRCKN